MESDIKVGSKIELIPGMDSVYDKAVAGSQGIVVAKKKDDGFAMIKVEWDKDHWRYNGEPDQWTYENHFQLAERTSLHEAVEDPTQFAHAIMDRMQDMGNSEEEIDDYVDKLHRVANLLAESEGFIILTARMEPSPTQPDSDTVIPYIYGAFLTPQAQMLLEAQLIGMAASAHQEIASRMIQHYKKFKDDFGEE